MNQPAKDDLEYWLEASVDLVQREKRAKRLKEKKMNDIVKHQEQPTELTAWRAMREQAAELVQSGFLPKAINTPEKAMAVIQTGKELGLGPMQSLRSIHIIEGKPTMSADLIAGLALAKVPGSVLRVAETTDSKCVIKAGRAGSELTTFTYTMSDAQRAGLTNKQNWRNYPRAMLRARAITEAARAIFPDAVMGLFDPDELGAVTSPTGELIQVTDVTPQPSQVSPFHGEAEGDEPGLLTAAEFMRTRTEQLEKLKSNIAFCKTWEEMLKLRQECGSHSVQSRLLKELQEYGPDKRIISGMEHKALSKLWQHCDRQLTKLEATIKPPPIEASFTDPEDDADAFGPEPAAE